MWHIGWIASSPVLLRAKLLDSDSRGDYLERNLLD
jgi:hypothetical protein